MSRNYTLISPVRNEAEYLPITIKSIISQTELPHKWIVVDDGSTDDTPRILEEAASRYPFIQVVSRKDRGKRAVGSGVINAFNSGLDTINIDDQDYICKCDGDLDFPPKYFEQVINQFEADPYLGNYSGKAYFWEEGELISEKLGDENAIGAVKFYRVACFKDIGGFVSHVCWDGIDGHMCRLKGWIAQSEDKEALRIIHLRRMGSSQKSYWSGRLRWGEGKYYMGSSFIYVTAASFYRAWQRPFFISGIGIFLGYLRAMFRQEQRFDNKEYLKFFKQYELKSLCFGKRRTMKKYHNRIRMEYKTPKERG